MNEKLILKCLKYLISETDPSNDLFKQIKIELYGELQEALNPKESNAEQRIKNSLEKGAKKHE